VEAGAMSRFAPVHLPEDRKLNGKVSQTFLKHYAGCPRAGYLYALHKGTASTREMQRGRAVHLVHERAVKLMIEHGEPIIPPEILKVLVNEVLAEVPVPFEEHDVIREMAYRLALEMAVDTDAVVACETLFVLEVGGYQVRCRIDYAQLVEDGAVLYVKDVKSSRAAPSFEEISRKRPDGTLAAKSMQLILYALAAVFGVPVREEMIDGERVEISEPFPVASHAQRVDLEFEFPAIEDREGKIVRRAVSLTRPELDEYMASLQGLLTRVAHSEETSDWPAVVSDDACSICPASALCPIPVELRDHRGEINTVEQAAEALEVRHREKAVARAKSKELREFVKRAGPVRYGDGMVAEIGYSTSEQIRDKDGFMDAVERTARYGEPLERHRFVKTVESFPLVERALTADELAEEVEDGQDSNGSGNLDERYGADAPW
jgi:hypothetical protein